MSDADKAHVDLEAGDVPESARSLLSLLQQKMGDTTDVQDTVSAEPDNVNAKSDEKVDVTLSSETLLRMMQQKMSKDSIEEGNKEDVEVALNFFGQSSRTIVSHGSNAEDIVVEHENRLTFMNPVTNIYQQVHQQEDDDAASIGDDSYNEKMNVHLPDEHGNMVHYPGDEVIPTLSSLEEGSVEPEQNKEAPHSVIGASINSLKYLYSMGLLVFSVIVVMALIVTKQTVGTAEKGIPPIVAFIVFWFLIFWLATMEGGQGALVGLQPIDPSYYEASHSKAFKVTKIAHKGDNMERFIIGRQFLVVLVVFVSNLMASSVEGATVLGLSGIAKEIFLGTGVSLILVAIIMGQLTAQVNAANCMLDFINNYFMLITTYASLAIEMSGLLHCVYLVQIVFAKVTGIPIGSNEAPRTLLQNVFFWGRVLMSMSILAFALAVTLQALFDGKTTMWTGVPESVSVIILFILMAFVGMMEGMQIALFAVVNMDEEELVHHKIAHRNCQLTFTGQNLQAFLIGRQILVTVCMFVVARITTLSITIGEDSNIFGVSDGVQEFFNTGLLGAVITTIVASLFWRIIASSFPLAFLSNPLVYLILRICMIIEQSGVCSAAWVLARYLKVLANYQPDEVHLEGAEPQTAEPVTRRDKDIDRFITILKFSYSLALLAFAGVLVVAAMVQEQTVGTAERGIHPAVALLIFVLLIFWLALMEGGQGALVGLQPIAKDRYARSHPKTHKNTSLAHRGDNMERFIVGRQFLVVLVVFVTNIMASTISDPEVLGLNDTVIEVFLNSGLSVILVTIMIGQLTAQVNSADCMLDFLNNYFMLATTYISLAIEMSGLLHSVYLVQILFSNITGTPIDSDEAPRTKTQKLFFWGRILLSLGMLCFALAVTLSALFNSNTKMWDGVPEWVSVILFLVLMCFVGIMEGMQIALFAVVNLPQDQLQHHSVAKANCELAFRDQNLQAFLIGRQIWVTLCMFVVARITTLNIGPNEPNIFGVSDSVQEFFNTGLLGALITTIIASLVWRIVASSFPLAFLSNPLIYVIIRLCLLVERTGVCSAAWVLGRWNKLFVDYQPDSVYLEGAQRHTREPVTRRDKDVDITITVIKYAYSTVLLVFSVTIVMATIFSSNTKLSQEAHPAVAFFVIWGLIAWLAMMEGGQGCLVGLQPVAKHFYADSHPVTLKSANVAHDGDNMERFIVGRQFLVVLVVFVINMCGSALEGTVVLGLPSLVNEIFVASGVAMIVMTIVIGQLTAQVNAANCMLDFINNYFMLFTTYVSLAIEYSGLLHCVYLVQIVFAKITGNPIESKEPPRSALQSFFFWTRVLLSLTILIFSFVVTLSALFAGKTAMWEGVPEAVSVVIFFLLMCFVGLMEGMQIALFAVVNLPDEELTNAKFAQKSCKLAFEGNNLQGFLIGRQICVTICMFVVARITTITLEEGESNIVGVSNGLQGFFDTGLLGAIITTLVGSLAWRIVASSFPVAFLSNPLVYIIIQLCLLLEATGVCASAWLLALIHRTVANYQADEFYIGSPGERAAKKEKGEESTEDS